MNVLPPVKQGKRTARAKVYVGCGEGTEPVSGKTLVTIKGVKDGLIFLLDDRCEWESLLKELENKLNRHGRQLSGPAMQVRVKLGRRLLDENGKEKIREIIGKYGNLLVESIESDADIPPVVPRDNLPLYRMTGIVRSGQTVEHDGHLLLLGDVNPGGTVRCTGDIYILGALRGIAHAGCEGDAEAIIAAAKMMPMQLRIADVVSRPPEEWVSEDSWMEFAYLRDGVMEIDRITQLHRFRKEATLAKGV